MYLMRDPESHKGFENECECYVYNYEVDRETLENHIVETIDEDEASECVKNQILGTHLLKFNNQYYINTGIIHPNKLLGKITQLAGKFKTDTTRLSAIEFHNNKNIITLKKKFSGDHFNLAGKYFDWQVVYLNNKDTLTIDSINQIKTSVW